MAGGQKIDNHSFWAGKGGETSPFPMGNKTKSESSAEGAGALLNYEDTTEEIKAAQVATEKKIKAHPMKPGYRH